MSSNNITERRRFSRIPFQAQAHIKTVSGKLHPDCDVIDISLNGILIAKPEKWNGQMNDSYQVDLVFEKGQLVIKMEAIVAHIDQQAIGFTCEHIDLDSITHLKRLVELNLGNEELLHRELSALIH
jgi:PilZ domain-containing protein